MNVGKEYLKREYAKSNNFLMTSPCSNNCEHKCGACEKDSRIKINDKINDTEYFKNITKKHLGSSVTKILFSFEKKDKAVFLSHINIMNVFERAFLRAGIEINYSAGFNPKPKLEFANPLSLGFSSNEEIAAIEVLDEVTDVEKYCTDFIKKMNNSLPEGISVKRVKIIDIILSEITGKKIKSLMASYKGSEYLIDCADNESADKLIKSLKDKKVEYDFSSDDKNLVIILKNMEYGENRMINLFRYLKEELELDNPFEYYNVTRNNNFAVADNDETVKSGAVPSDYFTSYKGSFDTGISDI